MLITSCFGRRRPAALPGFCLAFGLAAAALPLGAAEVAPLEGGCVADAQTLCLGQNRFEVRAIWSDYGSVSGAGFAHPISADSGYFDFFSPNNVEVLVKVLDGCAPRLGHRFWFFAGGLTDVHVELRVKDTVTGDFRLYTNRLGTTFDPVLDTDAFDTCDADSSEAAPSLAPLSFPSLTFPSLAGTREPTAKLEPAPSPEQFFCAPYPFTNRCLAGRFAVDVNYRLPNGPSRIAEGLRLTADTAAFYFYDANNYEVVVKVLDACAEENPGFWVFAAGLTDLEVEVVVTDRETRQSKTYSRGPGPFAPLLDLGSFPCGGPATAGE